ncbi:hypothetical protein CAC42_5419 [Sphaceloma murrayae]|uniref:alpha-galactosidase n=1 Tax=Sphaceloma murrayae TaxID=2082308 RepID=A0A2K1QV98_9PEZI|nr:hypothetical protein CAC42_5419 [Sphaceloma murrayae]
MKNPFVNEAREPGVEPLEMDMEEKAVRPRRSRRLKWIIAGAIILVALAVGLGVGLGLGLNNGGDDDDEGGSSPPSAPSPTGTVTNRTFWQPAAGVSWQIVLLNPITIADDATTATPDVDVYDIDLFTNNQSTITKLHSLNKKVICYFSAGSYEPNRPDSDQFTATDKGKGLDGWPGEVWLQTNSDNVRKIMSTRIKLASDKGCDAIDPDNVDGFVRPPFSPPFFLSLKITSTTEICMSVSADLRSPQQNDNGLGLTANDTVNFMQYLSDEASKYNMSTGLKNAGDVIDDVLPYTHFSVNEQCAEYSECALFAPFVEAGKPVFHIEYPKDAPSVSTEDADSLCSRTGKSAGSDNFSTVIKKMNLDGWVEYCDRSTSTTSTVSTSSSS